MSLEHATLKARVPKTDTVEEIFTKAFAEEHNNHKNSKPLVATGRYKGNTSGKKTIPPHS